MNVIKGRPSSNRGTQTIPLNKSSERLTDTVLKKQREENGFMQLPQAENLYFKTQIQGPHSWSGISKTTHSNVCFERTPKTKTLEKKEHNNICKSVYRKNPEVVLLPRIPNCRKPSENEEYVSKLTFPSRQSNILTHFNSEAGKKSKLDQYCQRLKRNNNNNKKQHLVTFAQYQNEIQALYIKPHEICKEKCACVPESQSYKVVEAEKIQNHPSSQKS